MQDPSEELIRVIASHDIVDKPNAVRWFLEMGADPNYLQSRTFMTPLLRAIMTGNVEVVIILLDAGADPNLNRGQVIPLHFALLMGNLDIINILLDAGADPNLQDKIGQTALMQVVAMGNLKTADLLLDRGADPSLKMLDGKTVFDRCNQTTDPELCLQRILDHEKKAFKTQYKNSLQMSAQQYSRGTKINRDPWLLILLNQKLTQFCDNPNDRYKYLGALWGLAEILDISYHDLMFNKGDLCDRLKERIKKGL